MAPAVLLGGEVGGLNTRLQLYPGKLYPGDDAAGSLFAHVYRTADFASQSSYLYSGLEMLIADFIEKARLALSVTGFDVPAVCVLAAKGPAPPPLWAGVSGARLQSKFGFGAVLLYEEVGSGGEVLFRQVKQDERKNAIEVALPPQNAGQRWTTESAVHWLAANACGKGLPVASPSRVVPTPPSLSGAPEDDPIPPVTTPGIDKWGGAADRRQHPDNDGNASASRGPSVSPLGNEYVSPHLLLVGAIKHALCSDSMWPHVCAGYRWRVRSWPSS